MLTPGNTWKADGYRVALLLPDSSIHIQWVAAALRSRSLYPVFLGRTEDIQGFLARWTPVVAVVGGGLAELDYLLTNLGRADVPAVMVGTHEQLLSAASYAISQVGIPVPADPEEIALAAANMAFPQDPATCGQAEVGCLRLDLVARVAAVEGQTVALPPKEFALLAELMQHPKAPIRSADLARRAWPQSPTATQEDVRHAVYRLRRMIGDDRRRPPLIHTRRGFGYVLDPSP